MSTSPETIKRLKAERATLADERARLTAERQQLITQVRELGERGDPGNMVADLQAEIAELQRLLRRKQERWLELRQVLRREEEPLLAEERQAYLARYRQALPAYLEALGQAVAAQEALSDLVREAAGAGIVGLPGLHEQVPLRSHRAWGQHFLNNGSSQ
jgi:hypothetical protein